MRLELDLTDSECRYLAMHARYAASGYQDLRYYRNLTREERQAITDRWLAIANDIHPDPWGEVTVQ